MADDTQDELNQLSAQLAAADIGGAGTLGANAATQQAYQAVLKNLGDRFGDYSKLQTPGYKNINPAVLGPSALSKIQPDAQSRVDQQAAEAALQNISNSGGLNLADRAALNNQEQILSRNNAARQNSLANQYAARGQLGSGAQLAMDLSNQQNAAQQANQRGESIAAQAQQRAMQAILDKAGIARNMSQDDYARAKAAADATDSINKYNASMSTNAQEQNNKLLEQGYNDQLRKLGGQNQLTGEMNTAILGSGKANANTIAGTAGLGSSLISGISAGGNALKKAGSSGGGGNGTDPNDPGLDTSGQNDLAGNRGGAADLSGGETDTEDPQAWASFGG
jgi:hypothetical protein